MAGKYTKQGVFPIILDGSEEISASSTWGEDTGKVGLIKNTGGNVLFLKSTDFPADNSGDSVYVVSLEGTCSISIQPDPFVDNDNLIQLTAGQSAWFMYHHDHGWLVMGNAALT